jgi:hypothetical protein
MTVFSRQDTDYGAVIPGSSSIPTESLANVIAVESNEFISYAIKSDGSVFSWVDPSNLAAWPSRLLVPATYQLAGAGIVQLSGTLTHVLARKNDGTVIAWGCTASDSAACDVPAGLTGVNRVYAAANPMDTSKGFSAAIKNDGTVVTWGTDAPTLSADQNVNVVDLIISRMFWETKFVILHGDGTVESNFQMYAGCDRMDFTCGYAPMTGISGITSFASDRNSDFIVMRKNDGTVWCACLGNVFQFYPASFHNMVDVAVDVTGVIGVRSDGAVVMYDHDFMHIGVFGPRCLPNNVTLVGAVYGGFFTIGGNPTICPSPTPTRTSSPTRTIPSRFSPTPVVSVTSTVTATPTKTATTVKTATRTATPKLGKPSATKSRTPTKAGKPTKTPTKKK